MLNDFYTLEFVAFQGSYGACVFLRVDAPDGELRREGVDGGGHGVIGGRGGHAGVGGGRGLGGVFAGGRWVH